ncbi:flavodoxin [Clostridia bacterium]|nr:flavodoxin [Clostridia bacterium]
MSNNIVVLSGSPRKNGTTDRLTAAFIAGAEETGKNVTLFRVAALRIGGCLGCNHCFVEQGVCVQKDDMIPILDALRQADAVVLAAPVYYFGVSAQLKLAIDRFFALLKEGMPVKRAALLQTCGNPSGVPAEPGILMFRQMSEHLKWEEAGVIVAGGLHAPEDIEGRKELDEAKALGRNI